MKADIAAANPFIMPERVNVQRAKGKIAAAEREPAETRLDRMTAGIKTRMQTAKATGDKTMKHPAAVATPLPPVLNPK